MERAQEENVRHELDTDFNSLRDLIYAPDPSSTGSNSVPLGRPRPDMDIVKDKITEDVDYDQHVRELAFDKRSKPKNRTKTEEELALEEKEALEKAERRRRKRMLGLEESDSEDEDKPRGKRKRGADDLDDDFNESDTERNGLGAGLGDEKLVDETEESDGAQEEEDSEGDDDDNDGGDDDDEDDELDGSSEDLEGDEGEEGEHEDLVRAATNAKGKTKKQGRSNKELPFTFPCPSTHEEFLEIVDDIDDKDVPIVVQRIRALYHTSLSPENKFKLQVNIFFFFVTLMITLIYFHRLYQQS